MNDTKKENNQKNTVKNKRGTDKKVPPKYTFENLEKIKKEQQVVDMYVKEIDDSLNMIGVIGNNIKAIVPREEASSVVGEDGFVEQKHIINKKGKIIQVCIKDIVKTVDKADTFEVILSKKILELKVRAWMYVHLKPKMKLKGIVVSTTEYAAFVDLGGGVTGILKLSEISDIMLQHASDVFKVGQRIEVVVKSFDKDTGRIELTYKELLGSFEEIVKELKENDIVDGVVRNRIKSGVFVELKPNLVGLAEHVNGIEYGQKVLVSIKRIIPEKKKIKLVIIG